MKMCLVTVGVRQAFQHTEMLHYLYIISQMLFGFLLPLQLQNYCALITFIYFFLNGQKGKALCLPLLTEAGTWEALTSTFFGFALGSIWCQI